MWIYALKRLIGAVPTLLILLSLAFFLVRAAPGGPFDTDRALPPEIEANLRAKYHLDEPLWQQYFRYLWEVAHGDLGPSFQYRDYTVNELIASGFPISLRLGALAMLVAFVFGTAAGMLAALYRNGWVDYTVMSLAMTGISVPNFVVAPLLVLIFAINLHWLPAGGYGGGAWQNLILPVIALALPHVAYISRLMRGSMIEVLNSPYIRTARAKGLPRRVILLRHAFLPAIVPIVSYLGPAFAAIITGSVVIEQIFGIPGIGRYFVQGAINRDYTLVLGVVVFYGILVIIMNLVVDLMYAWMDPRVRL